MNVAMPGAEVTMHASAAFRLPPARFVQFFRLLEDFYLAHTPILLLLKSYAPLRVPSPHCVFALRSNEGRSSFRRGAGCSAARAAVPRPSPQNSSCSNGISRIAGGIFARPDLPLL